MRLFFKVTVIIFALSFILIKGMNINYRLQWFKIFGSTPNTITVSSSGQLGNQLFEYWSAKSYALKHNKTLLLSSFSTLYSYFDIPEFHSSQIPFSYPKLPPALQVPFRTQKATIYHKIPMEKDFVFFNGVMQSYANLKEHEDIIRQQTIFKIKPNRLNQALINKMQMENSISIHVRRGDYIRNNYTLLSQNWYQKAITLMNTHIKNPVYYIFADDIKWAKENLKIEHPHIFIDWNRKQESYNDMRLMSHCKHNIIANSTFSWWGAFLGNPKGRLVIMPNKWIPWKPNWEKELIVPGWIILPVE